LSLIHAENLTKDYRAGDSTVPVLRGVSFVLDAGELASVIGPSGSGKSTLLSILGGLNPPTGGRLVVDGIDVYALGSEQRADFRNEYVGFVFQEFQLLPYLDARQNVMLPLAIGGLPHREQVDRAENALARVGLGGKGRRLPSQLSGGEQERVAIARAVVNEPPILLADEPTGALDSRTGQEIMELFAALNAAGQSIVMVTHNLANLSYASRVFDMRDGRLAPAAGVAQ
jgi:putative ABC transport system ATP-binding protein